MKMLKKCLFTIAMVVFLAVTVQAGDPAYDGTYKGHPWPWPKEWKEVTVCVIPVYMEVGYWIEIEDCQDLEILLKQVPCDELMMKATTEWPCYQGCEKLKVRTNFEAELEARLDNRADLIDGYDEGWDKSLWDDKVVVGPTGGNWEELEVCVELWSTDLWTDPATGVKQKVGTLKIQVKPTGAP
jgi:hypothetical protein